MCVNVLEEITESLSQNLTVFADTIKSMKKANLENKL